MNVPLKRYQKEFEHSYSFGVFPTLELLRHRPEHVLGVLVHSKGIRNEGLSKLAEVCGQLGIRFEANDKTVERLSPKENVYAVGVFRKYRQPLSHDESHVVLVNPGDMGNLGTVMRTMLGFGVSNLALVRPAADIFDPRVVRASMGAIFALAFGYFDSFDLYRQTFPHRLYPFMTDGKVTLAEAMFEEPYALVFGNESAGLPGEYLEVGTSVSIPHSDAIDSLNLTVAVGIALYEATEGDFNVDV